MTPRRCLTARRLRALAVAVMLLPAAAWGQSPDRVKLTAKVDGVMDIIGEIVSLSPGDIEIRDQRGDEVRKVPIDRVREVLLGGEPESLRNARKSLLNQDAAGALEELGRMDKAELDGATDNVLAELAFVQSAAAARVATATGTGLPEAEKGLRDFLAKHPRSHHVFRVNELLGDLLVRARKFDEAAAAYAALEKGPPAFRVRAATAKGGSFYEQKKYEEADKEYAAAIAAATDPKDEASARQKREAQTGRARCLTRQEKPAEAVKILQEVIRAADPEDRELLARAYVVLGDAHRAAKADQDALIAYLTVDLVYNTVPEIRAEALYNLVQLWQKAQNPERSREARQSLLERYPGSRWAEAAAETSGKG